MNTNLFKQIAAGAKQALKDSERAVNALGDRLHTAAADFLTGDAEWRNDPSTKEEFQVIGRSFRPFYVVGYLSCLGLVTYCAYFWAQQTAGATFVWLRVFENAHMFLPTFLAINLLVGLLLLPYAPLLIRPLSMLRTLRNTS